MNNSIKDSTTFGFYALVSYIELAIGIGGFVFLLMYLNMLKNNILIMFIIIAFCIVQICIGVFCLLKLIQQVKLRFQWKEVNKDSINLNDSQINQIISTSDDSITEFEEKRVSNNRYSSKFIVYIFHIIGWTSAIVLTTQNIFSKEPLYLEQINQVDDTIFYYINMIFPYFILPILIAIDICMIINFIKCLKEIKISKEKYKEKLEIKDYIYRVYVVIFLTLFITLFIGAFVQNNIIPRLGKWIEYIFILLMILVAIYYIYILVDEIKKLKKGRDDKEKKS